jgi:hypothetical protein
MDFGSFSRSSAPVEVTTTFSSTSTPGRPAASRARGDDDVLRLVHLVADLDLARPGDRGPALQPGHLVLLEQELDALGVLADHLVLVGAHLRPIDLGPDADPHLVEVLVRLVQHVGRVQQRLRRDAADIQAGAAQRLAPLDAGDLHAELSCAARIAQT